MHLDSIGLFVVVAIIVGFMQPAFAGYASLVLGWVVYVQNRKQQSDIKRLAGTISALAILLSEDTGE